MEAVKTEVHPGGLTLGAGFLIPTFCWPRRSRRKLRAAVNGADFNVVTFVMTFDFVRGTGLSNLSIASLSFEYFV
jgi:hypothetical protein